MVDDRNIRPDPRGRTGTQDEDVKVIPLVEERLSVGKQKVEQGVTVCTSKWTSVKG